MGIFDRFRRKRPDEPDEPDELDDDEDEWEDDWDSVPADAVALVREGHSMPTEEHMREVLEVEAPECVDLPKTGLVQMRWWQQTEWVSGGLRHVAVALRNTYGIDPDKTTWKVVKDDHGARVGIVFMRK